MTDEEYENELQRSFELGKSEGLSIASKIILDEAVFYFKLDTNTLKSSDDISKVLKAYAEKLKNESELVHPGVPHDNEI